MCAHADGQCVAPEAEQLHLEKVGLRKQALDWSVRISAPPRLGTSLRQKHPFPTTSQTRFEPHQRRDNSTASGEAVVK